MTSPSPSTSASAAPAPRRDIQGLRAVAVVAVLLSHALGWPAGGFAGVDVFFVLSGFLITGMLLRDVAETGRVRFARFYAARARRILPTAVVVLAAVVAAGFALFPAARADQTLADGIWSAVFAVNWHFAAAGTDYFGATDAVSPLQHFWTLSVEEQFYLVWPLLILLVVLCVPRARRSGIVVRIAVAALATAAIAASVAWGAVQTAGDPTVAYFSTATRAWELAVGALLAAAAPLFARLPVVLGGVLSWAGAAGVVASFFLVDADSPFPVPGAVLPVLAAAVAVVGGIPGDPRHRHLFPLTNPVSVFVGDMSYSLYLWHFPVIVFAAVLLPPGPVTTALVLGVAVLLGIASYLALEQPLHRSPLLRDFRSAPAFDAPAREVERPHEEPAPLAPARPASIPTTRPAGWQPGRRYFPGAAIPSSAAAPEADSAAGPTDSADLVLPGPAESGESADPGARESDVTPPAPSVRTPAQAREARRAAWAAWRARFGARIGGGLVALALGAGAVVLVLQSTGPAGLFPQFDVPAPTAQADGPDPVVELQAELETAAEASGWPDLAPAMDAVIRTGSADNPAAACFSPDADPDLGACTWGSASAPHHLYLVGDSTAMAYAPAFRKIADDSGGQWRITTVGLYGCRFTDVLVANDGAGVMDACPGRKDFVSNAIRADQPDAVVVSNAYTLGHTVEGTDLGATSLASAAAALAETWEVPGRVVYLSPPPPGIAPDACYSPAGGPQSCLAGVDASWQNLDAATAAVASSHGDRAIDSRALVCWNDLCPAFAGTTPLRFDSTHLTVAYAEKIAPALRAELAAAGVL